MNDLVTWLREQIAEDRRMCREVIEPFTPQLREARDEGDAETALVLADMMGPYLRMAAEASVRERIVDQYEAAFVRRKQHPDDLASTGALLVLHGVMKLLALPYAGRPGYRDEWRP